MCLFVWCCVVLCVVQVVHRVLYLVCAGYTPLHAAADSGDGGGAQHAAYARVGRVRGAPSARGGASVRSTHLCWLGYIYIYIYIGGRGGIRVFGMFSQHKCR